MVSAVPDRSDRARQRFGERVKAGGFAYRFAIAFLGIRSLKARFGSLSGHPGGGGERPQRAQSRRFLRRQL